jgi:class 3 adenylate cyclase
MEYTVISATVNTAQRIEELCKELGWDLLIGVATYEEAKDVIEVGEPVRTRLRGQSRDRLVYPLLGLRGAVPPTRLDAYRALRAIGWLSPAPNEDNIPQLRLSI